MPLRGSLILCLPFFQLSCPREWSPSVYALFSQVPHETFKGMDPVRPIWENAW